jgi:hypothetical protein
VATYSGGESAFAVTAGEIGIQQLRYQERRTFVVAVEKASSTRIGLTPLCGVVEVRIKKGIAS